MESDDLFIENSSNKILLVLPNESMLCKDSRLAFMNCTIVKSIYSLCIFMHE